jgi:hypothetical protein
MALDRSTAEAVIQHYFDGLAEHDADKLSAIFHPTADLRWQESGTLKIVSVPDWMEMVRGRKAKNPAPHARDDFIVTLDRSDAHTAFAKVRCQIPPRSFTDYLVLMKLAEGWTIVSKSYRYDQRETI